MKTLICATALFAALATPAAAEMQYDRKLEQAVMAIVAGKIGDIRGGLSYDRRPQFVPAQSGQDDIVTGGVGELVMRIYGDRQVGMSLALASERRISRVISF